MYSDMDSESYDSMNERTEDEMVTMRPAKKRAMVVEQEKEEETRKKQAAVDENRVRQPGNGVHGGDIETDVSMDQLFPWVNQTSNIITQLVQTKLMERYRTERGIWSVGMHTDFKRVAPKMDFSIRPTTSSISNHDICKKASTAGATWIDFWFLRVMFGPCACAKQSWFPDLAEQYPWMLDQAATGVVPSNIDSIMDMGESDCRCNFSSAVEHATTRPHTIDDDYVYPGNHTSMDLPQIWTFCETG
ncbi:uncharacterized protein TRIVIDRAFT_197799 [Trichoderma virens Gv29-8]|uniref:Uncharacterized protein n=1 Tax=Hypocrea virens (strain Gv29-8 / FGSC 10586) TaxID=413071 RepID=G9MFV0_HYPVG|nr:uncharacterized protein TRIVIDRAFT_197799 [Trichoderma virens Gv29-8]EHK26401.1 hypothetical protein TRIVIDRAFT_197799 [Trichoderma virens Gv29-8]